MTAGARPGKRRSWVAMPLSAALALGGALGPAGCATTVYSPQVVARGELTLRYDEGFEMWAGGRRVARGLSYDGLPHYVRCVPAAAEQARAARHDGIAALTLSALGGSLGVISLGGLYGLNDSAHQWAWFGSGIATAVTGTVLAGLGRLYRNSANGHAVDAMNFYNDSVGSLGATCDDLRYPPPLGPIPTIPPSAAPPSPDAPPPPLDAPAPPAPPPS
jgi:hypothetical protein